MTLQWDRRPITGGSVSVAEADVADGHVLFAFYYQVLADEWFEPVAEVCNGQSATLNGCLVKDPGYAQQLLNEAMAQ
jgi:hypothetical protein